MESPKRENPELGQSEAGRGFIGWVWNISLNILRETHFDISDRRKKTTF